MADWMDFWGLKGDPFADADEPVHYNNPSLPSIIVKTKAVKELEEILYNSDSIEQKKLFIIGDGGIGKSQCIYYIISKNLEKIQEKKTLPIYIPFTQLNVFDELQYNISDENYSSRSSDLFRKLDMDFNELTLKALTADLLRFIEDNNINLADFFKPQDYIKLKETIRNSTNLFLGKVDFSPTSKTPVNMLASTQEMLRLLSKGFNKILLIYDEIDKAENPDIVFKFLSSKRGIFSSFVNEYKCQVVFSGRLSWKPVLGGSEYSDIFGRVIEIKPYTDNEAAVLLKNRIYFRNGKIPFEDSDISFIVEENRGNPRYIQWAFRSILQQMAKKGNKSIKNCNFKTINIDNIKKLEDLIREISLVRKGYIKLDLAVRSNTPGYFFEIIKAAYYNRSIPLKVSKSKLKTIGLDMSETEYQIYTERLVSMGILAERTKYLKLEDYIEIFYNKVVKVLKEKIDIVPRIISAIGPIERAGVEFNVKSYVDKVLREQTAWLDVNEIINIILLEKEVKKDAMRQWNIKRIDLLRNKMRPGVLSHLTSQCKNGEVLLDKKNEKNLYILHKYFLQKKLKEKEVTEVITPDIVRFILQNIKERIENIQKIISQSDNKLNAFIEIEKESEKLLDDNSIKALKSILLKGDDEAKKTAVNLISNYKDIIGKYIIFIIDNYKDEIIKKREILDKSKNLLKALHKKLIYLNLNDDAETITSRYLPTVNNILTLTDFINEAKITTDLGLSYTTVNLKNIDKYIDKLIQFERKRKEFEEKTECGYNSEIARFGATLFDKNLDYSFLLKLNRIDIIKPTILYGFGISPDHISIQQIIKDSWTREFFKNIIVFFIDGLGYINWKNIIKTKEKQNLLTNCDNIPKTIEPIPLLSTLPSHTACAEPTIFSGVMPTIHEIVGKKFWYRPDNIPIDIFGEGKFRIKNWAPIRKKMGEYSLFKIFKDNEIEPLACFDIPYSNFSENVLRINEENYVYKQILRDRFNEVEKHIKKFNKDEKSTFSIITTTEYDTISHESGPYHEKSVTRLKENFSELNNFISTNKTLLKNSLIIIISDHGITECGQHPNELIDLYTNKEIEKFLKSEPKNSILISGSRFAHIYLKEDLDLDKSKELLDILKKTYSNIYFYEKQILRKNGYCLNGLRCGDIVAVAGSNCIFLSSGDQSHRGYHGGSSAEEMLAMMMAWKI